MERQVWKALSLAIGAATGFVVKQAATAAWRAARHGDDPPSSPAAKNVPLLEAMIWAASAALGAAIARVLAERGAARAWEAATGSPPTAVEG